MLAVRTLEFLETLSERMIGRFLLGRVHVRVREIVDFLLVFPKARCTPSLSTPTPLNMAFLRIVFIILVFVVRRHDLVVLTVHVVDVVVIAIAILHWIHHFAKGSNRIDHQCG